MRLKQKYTCRSEPDHWKGRSNSKFKNTTQWGSGANNHPPGNTGIKHVNHPRGATSGRSGRPK